VGKDVTFKFGGDSMHSAMYVRQYIGAAPASRPAVVAFGCAHAFCLVSRFLVKPMQICAYACELLTSHAASIAQGPNLQKRITDVT
jgi:hypothetical protein